MIFLCSQFMRVTTTWAQYFKCALASTGWRKKGLKWTRQLAQQHLPSPTHFVYTLTRVEKQPGSWSRVLHLTILSPPSPKTSMQMCKSNNPNCLHLNNLFIIHCTLLVNLLFNCSFPHPLPVFSALWTHLANHKSVCFHTTAYMPAVFVGMQKAWELLPVEFLLQLKHLHLAAH